MKIYVDEMPKSCFECPCFRNDIVCNCGLDDGTNDYFLDEIDGGDCPLQLLSDHDKQVRKEVCEDVRKLLPNYIYSFQEPDTPRTKVIELEDVRYILDQIQGETK